MKKTILPAIILVLLTVLIVQAMGTNAEKTTQEIKEDDKNTGLGIGLKAPDFELKNLSGEPVKLSNYNGKKVMLNFWATWCPPCKAEMPDMQKLHEEARDDLVILAVNIDPENDVAGFAKQMGISFPILIDKDYVVNKTYQIISIPTSYFIDENGIIQAKHIGAMNLNAMKQYIGDM